jgi:hypothetical protein
MMCNNSLIAGSAKIKLAYPEGFFPHKSFRGRYFTGVHDDLYARALYAVCDDESALFINIELGDVTDRWIGDISAAADVPVERIFLAATHTHAAPHADGTWPEDVIDSEKSAEFSELCRHAVIEAAKLSKRQTESARVSFGASSCEVNVNRDYKYSSPDDALTASYIQAPNPCGVSDKILSVLKFENLSGELIGCIANYAVHSNVTFYQTWTYEDSMLVSSDLAGTAARYVEDRIGGITLFMMGPAADQMPRYIANHRVFDKYGGVSWNYYGRDAAFVLLDAQGTELGAAILRALENCNAGSGNPLIRSARHIVLLQGKKDGYPAVEEQDDTDEYRKNYKESIPKNFKFIETMPLEMHIILMRIGNVLLIGLPAEIVANIGSDIKRCVPKCFEAVIITQCNGSFSYISDDIGYELLTFEAVASHVMPGSAQRIINGIKAMIENIYNNETLCCEDKLNRQ